MKDIYEVAIVDDEEVCASNLRNSLAVYDKVRIVGTANNPKSGVELILEKQPDLLFLDVELPGKTGLQLLSEIRNKITWNMQVIFYTAYEKYLLQALRESAFDYLLKPYQPQEFNLVMTRFFEYETKNKQKDTFVESFSRLIPENRSFMIATITGFQTLRPDDIGYFEYNKIKKHWYVYLQNNNSFQLRRKTSAETILCHSSSFAQINQQQIINIKFLSFIDGKQCLLFPPFDGENELIISRNFLKGIQEKFDII